MSKKTAKKRRKKSGHGGGGSLSGFRSGFKSFVGTGSQQRKKESTLSKLITLVLIALALALLVYRFTQ